MPGEGYGDLVEILRAAGAPAIAQAFHKVSATGLRCAPRSRLQWRFRRPARRWNHSAISESLRGELRSRRCAIVELIHCRFRGVLCSRRERIYRALAVMLRNPDLAAEATDEAMTRAFQRWNVIRGYDNRISSLLARGAGWAPTRATEPEHSEKTQRGGVLSLSGSRAESDYWVACRITDSIGCGDMIDRLGDERPSSRSPPGGGPS